MRFYYSGLFNLRLPAGHRFPAGKYALLRQHLLDRHIVQSEQLHQSPAIGVADLLRVHEGGYVDAILEGTAGREVMRRIGFPWSAELPQRSRVSVGGSVAAAFSALEHGISGQLAGGTHHAHADCGSGYCVFNDHAVAAMMLVEDGHVGRVAIVDGDVHQGDGNAALLRADPRVFVASIHGARNFPFRKCPSDLDVALDDGTGDDAYLRALDDMLAAVWNFRPDIVLYQAGVDPLAADRLGRLALSYDGLAARDRMVLSGARARGVPIAMAIGGGYAEPIALSVRAYANTYEVAKEIWRW